MISNIIDMEFKIRPFKELLGMSFNIPSYQRGYRWEKENVEALLNDVQEFATKTKKEEGEFYCLQPVVVRVNKQLSEERTIAEGNPVTVYDLLDGQQRLTTLWLILNQDDFKSLWNNMDRNHADLYSMEYESRTNLFDKAIDKDSDMYENIDLFYLKNAYNTIAEWDGDKVEVIKTIVPKLSSENTNDVRIIWYEFDKDTEGEEIRQASSIKVFSRLNYGKIALTDTELIKALILQSDIYPDDNSEKGRNAMREHLFRIATEWDDIEKGLHNDLFWGMLTPEDYKPANHLELILRFVAEKIQKEKGYRIIDHQRRDFHIIASYLGVNSSVLPSQYAENVDHLWSMIRDIYISLYNWYTNETFYHLIGLNVLIQGGSNPIPLITDIYNKYCSVNKESFRLYLESEIGRLIEIQEKVDDNLGKKITVDLRDLQYGIHNPRIIKILEALNIYLHITNKHLGFRFNFKNFKGIKDNKDKKVTSLEHIHPQHLNFDDNVKYKDVYDWYNNTFNIISSDPEYSKNEQMQTAINLLGDILKDEEKFKEQIAECQKNVEEIDRFFDKHAQMDTGHMHTLYNLALVDKDTNAALSNNLIDVKRKILQKREEQGETYVPIATNYVFNKHFSNHISEMKFWNKDDREAYFAKIEEAYHYFINKKNIYMQYGAK